MTLTRKLITAAALAAFILATSLAYAQNPADCGTVNDRNGNTYTTVVMGGDCWLRENLRTTEYADGRVITPAPLQPAFACQDAPNPGLLYNWHTVLKDSEPTEEIDGRVQGPCPDGWHVPSNFEWMNLEDFAGYKDFFRCGDDVFNIAKALAFQSCWEAEPEGGASECTPAAETGSNNATGFSALPTGNFWNGTHAGNGTEAVFWTCSDGGEETAPAHYIHSSSPKFEINCTPKDAFCSVRCVKNKQ